MRFMIPHTMVRALKEVISNNYATLVILHDTIVTWVKYI